MATSTLFFQSCAFRSLDLREVRCNSGTSSFASFKCCFRRRHPYSISCQKAISMGNGTIVGALSGNNNRGEETICSVSTLASKTKGALPYKASEEQEQARRSFNFQDEIVSLQFGPGVRFRSGLLHGRKRDLTCWHPPRCIQDALPSL